MLKDLQRKFDLLEKRISLIRENCPVHGTKKIEVLKQEQKEILKALREGATSEEKL